MMPGADRPFIAEDFVGREDAMASLAKLARQETEKRLLLLLGPFGYGKSWLLSNLETARREIGVESVLIGFAVPPIGAVEWGYLDVVERIRQALGPDHFAELDAVIAAAREQSAGLGLADAFATQLGGAPGAAAPAEGAAIAARVGDVGAGAQVAVGSNIVMAQGDVHYTIVQQGPQAGAAVLQQHQAAITDALLRALAALTERRKVTFEFDAWQRATAPTRDWLCRTLLAAILDKTLPGAAAIIADDVGVPEYQQRHPRVHPMPLGGLDADDIAEYWIERRGLDREKAPMVVAMCQGHPLTLAMIADLHDQAGGGL